MRGSAAAAVLVLLLAGCSGKPSTPAPAPPGATPTGADAAAALQPPTWAVGQYWTFDSPQGGTFSHAVSKDAGDDWILDTDNQDLAFFDARSDISFLGKVRKSDLAGSQGPTRVEFLHWPLAAHMNWTTTWDGQPTMVHVLSVADGKATLQATRANSGLRYADYTYDGKAGYFSHFAFYDPQGKEVGFEWSLRQGGQGFAAPLVRWSIAEVVNITGPIPTASANSRTFDVPAGLTDLWAEGHIACTQGAVVAAVGPLQGPAENRGYAVQGACPLADDSAYSIPAPAQKETWGQMVTGAPAATTGTIDLHVWQRTLAQFQAGQAP